MGSDFRGVSPVYAGPERRKGADGTWAEGLWGEVCSSRHNDSGVYQDVIHLPYAGIENVAQLDKIAFPSADWFDYSGIRKQCSALSGYAVFINGAGALDFLNGIGRCRGQEQVLLDVATEDAVFIELVERRFHFFYQMIERTLQAANGLVDLVWVGEDLGTQQGPLISPRTFDRLFADKYRRVFALAHEHGARTIMHSCGAVRAFIPSLIEIGLNILDVVQVSAVGMELSQLKKDFGSRLSFSGTMCVQTTLPDASPDEIRSEVIARQRLFSDGGLILGPTNTIELGTPIENIVAMYEAAGSLRRRPPRSPVPPRQSKNR